jgi:WhiB family redox-sensing transcriptional regulator
MRSTSSLCRIRHNHVELHFCRHPPARAAARRHIGPPTVHDGRLAADARGNAAVDRPTNTGHERREVTMSDVSRLPGPMDHAWQWQRLGACRGMDSAVFFHPDGERNPSRARRTAHAKEVCARCPVIAQCREFALQTREPFGVWGGLAEAERKTILESRGIAIAS